MLKDKVIIVFGGSGLIGSEIVKDIEENHGIAINADINSEEYKVNIVNNQDIKDIFKIVFDKYNRLDGVVTAMYPRTKDWGAKFEETTFYSWQKNVEMQLNPIMTITQEALKYMKIGSSIVNIGSIYGELGNDFTVYEGTNITSPAVYSAIKAGIINFTKYIASYVGYRGIRANCVSPGIVFNNQNSDYVENYSNKVPMKRMARAEEIAPAVTFLLSNKASYITGHNLLVDGGWSSI